MTTEQKREGWHFPPGSRKAHYWREPDSRSLCGRYGFFNAWQFLQPDTGSKGPDDCAGCRKKLDRAPTPEPHAEEDTP